MTTNGTEIDRIYFANFLKLPSERSKRLHTRVKVLVSVDVCTWPVSRSFPLCTHDKGQRYRGLSTHVFLELKMTGIHKQMSTSTVCIDENLMLILDIYGQIYEEFATKTSQIASVSIRKGAKKSSTGENCMLGLTHICNLCRLWLIDHCV